VLLAVELLVYPARYQWNDVRGFVADQRHASGGDRGRLPGPLSRARSRVSTSCVVAAAKLAAAGLLVVVLPELHLAGILLFATIGVFAVAFVYEALRSASTGRSAEAPAPVTPGIVSLWIVVGAGYVVRGVTGLALAIDVSSHVLLAAAATVTLWAYGVAFVTSRWALEALAFATCDEGAIAWSARADQAREHLLALGRWLPRRVEPHEQVRDWAPLRRRTPIQAPWNVAMIIAGASSGVTGRLLCGPSSTVQGATLALLGGAFTLVAVTAPGWRVGVVVGGAVSMGAAMALSEASSPVLGALPWTLISGAYLFFSSRTLNKLGTKSLVTTAASACLAPLARLILGRPTYEAVCAGAAPLAEKGDGV
jgi:hypothetical protein